MRWYDFAMDRKYPAAYYGAAIIHQLGLGTKVNLKEAVRLYTESSNRGHRIAPFMLGQLYETGTGVPKNITEAIRWYQLSAKRKYARAGTRARKLLAKNYKPNG